MKKFAVIIFAFILSCTLAACGGNNSTGRTGGTGGASGGTDSGGSAQTQTNDATPTPTPDDSSDAAVSTPEPAPPSASVAVGDIMKFGGYEWRVLEVSDGKVLLLSEYVLEWRAYNGELTDVTWETCTLRAYLNGEFYDSFSPDDRARIAPTRNSNKDNQWYGAAGGNDTDDYVFLLSLEEVVRYFGDSGQLANQPEGKVSIDDEYNVARIAYSLDGPASWWWLRSPGYDSGSAAGVDDNGNIVGFGNGVTRDYNGIRPALWLNLE